MANLTVNCFTLFKLQLALILPTQENYLASLANNNRMHVVDFMKVCQNLGNFDILFFLFHFILKEWFKE